MAFKMTWLSRLRRCDSGAEFVEAAFAFPLLMLLVLGIMDFGLLFQQYEVITNAAREGARIAVLPNYHQADVESRVNDYISASLMRTGSSPAPTATVHAPTAVITPAGNCMSVVQVDVTYDHQYLFIGGISKFFGGNFTSTTLKASSTMRQEVAGGACP